MSAPRRWARRAALSVLAGGGLTAGLGAPLPGAALGAEPPAGAAGGAEGSTSTQPTTGTTPQAPAPAPGGGAGESSTTTSTTPSPAAGSSSSSSSSSSGSATAPATSGSAAPPTATVPTTPAPAAVPTVVVQRPQQVTAGTRTGASTTGGGGSGSAGAGAEGSGGGSVPAHGGTGAGHNGPAAIPPGTPNGVAPAPQAAGGEVSSLAALLTGSAVSAQALDYFRVPLFLLPIYKAAAFQYDVPWQVLAAINEVETDYGTDLSVSTAGAVGWMQFMPATWQLYGVDATFAGYADPYNPADAVFAAARYLHAAGASHNLDAAILAYNHSQAYVESVVLRARLLASFPRSVIGTLTGLVDGRAPTPGARVLAPASTAGSGPAAPAPGEGAAVAPTSSAPGGPAAPTPSAAAAGVTAGTAAAPGTTVATPGGPTPGSAGQGTATTASAARPAARVGGFPSTPAPSPQVAAARARAAANAPAKPSQLVEVLGVPGAPVVAVQNGRVVHLGRSRALGRYLVLRDVYGDLFTYAGLGSIAPRYRPSIPALARGHAGTTPTRDPAPTLPASAGHQRPVTLRVRAHAAPASAPVQAQGAAAPAGVGRVRLFAHPGNPLARAAARTARRSTGTGSGRWLALRTGAIVSEGTVLGHLAAPAGASVGRLRFAVRPAGDSGTIDPRPLLQNWSELDRALHPKGSRSTGALLGATAGDVLSMSRAELERAVLADTGIGLDACGRRDVTAGAVDARVLAALLFLSRSGLQPTATLRCPRGAGGPGPGAAARASSTAGGALDGVDITALNGVPVAGHQGPGTVTDAAIRTLLTLRGRLAPHRIVSLMSYPAAPATHALPSAWGHIAVDFPPPRPAARAAAAHTAAATGPAAASPLAVTGELSGAQWSELVTRIAALPQPRVAAGPSAAAIRDPQAAPTNRGLGSGG
jgi:hypothetical protein